LAKRFRTSPFVASVKLIDTASVPVLKLVMVTDKSDSSSTFVCVDITVDADLMPHSGVSAR
jgi:hypothetical protein